ncbi:MAG: hypothetical protein SCJ93_09880 [Bacillota bacterium]|nr:hypothetical protein [Bacillota bacterium]
MSIILIILDGVSEENIKFLENKTPLEYADTKTINTIKNEGFHFRTKFHEKDLSPNSLNCILKILGVKRKNIPKHRAFLEALSSDIPLSRNEVVFRCNLISLKNNLLQSFNGEGIEIEDKKIKSEKLTVPEGIRFYHLGNYKNLLVMDFPGENFKLKDFIPHERIGDSLKEYMEEISNIPLLKTFVDSNSFDFNGRKYLYLPWGPSLSIELPSFESLHNKTCFSVSHAKIVQGISKAMNIETAVLKKSTGDIDTDLREKLKSVLNNKENKDVIVAHINGTDEVSHRKNIKEKINFIEKIDEDFIKPIYTKLKSDDRIIILSDHQTSSITGKHEEGYVDVITNKKYINKNNLFI